MNDADYEEWYGYTFSKKEETPAEKAKRIGVPLIGRKRKEIRPKGDPFNPTIGVCGLCGMELTRVMYFSCSRNGCPIQPRITL